MTAIGQAMREASLEKSGGAFAECFEQYKTRCYYFALHLVGNREDAMDITQEAFLRLYRQWDRRDDEASPAAWLYTVVRNLAVDQLRWRSRRGELSVDDASAAAAAPGPEAQAATSEMEAKLREELNALPPEQREVLMLRDWHELNYAEIAAILGISIGTVSSRLHYAREQLRLRLRRYL